MQTVICPTFTGKSLSEALIFASTNPQYDNSLFIELQVQYMKIPSSNLGRTCCVQKLFLTFRTIFVHNMFSPCSTKRRASDKNLPVSFMTSSSVLFKFRCCWNIFNCCQALYFDRSFSDCLLEFRFKLIW